ncbi:MAG TPA: ribosome recycling factor [Anaerolineae bacterium]|nr:ribosome recycling factor [Anaerolineae bacterium]
MVKDILKAAEGHMHKSIEVLEQELKGIRTGRAAPALVERLPVPYYGTPTPLEQLATISAPEPQLLTIRPYDPNSLKDIERAILSSELGLTPNNDGKMIRLQIPRLTEERRHELVKLVHKRLEETRVAVRNVRRDAQDQLRDAQKEKLISEDDLKRGRDDLQKLTDKMMERVEAIGQRKEDEIREV